MDVERIEDWYGQEVVDTDGEKVGKLEEVFKDVATGEPTLGSIKTGLFGRKLSIVPLEGASLSRDFVRVAYTKDAIKDAPQTDGGKTLSGAEEGQLFTHYGINREASAGPDDVRYESAGLDAERASEAAALRKEAHELEAEASKRDEDAHRAEEKAAAEREAGTQATRERDENLSEAEKLRARADEAERRT